MNKNDIYCLKPFISTVFDLYIKRLQEDNEKQDNKELIELLEKILLELKNEE